MKVRSIKFQTSIQWSSWYVWADGQTGQIWLVLFASMWACPKIVVQQIECEHPAHYSLYCWVLVHCVRFLRLNCDSKILSERSVSRTRISAKETTGISARTRMVSSPRVSHSAVEGGGASSCYRDPIILRMFLSFSVVPLSVKCTINPLRSNSSHLQVGVNVSDLV